MSTIEAMLSAGVHFGHKTRFWNPEMSSYIFGSRENLHIFDLRITASYFEKALHYIEGVVGSRGTVLFVGTKRQAQDCLVATAVKCGMPYVNKRWLGGMLTNFKTIKQSIDRLKRLTEELKTADLSSLKKKERLTMVREHRKLEDSLGGVKDMKNLPDALFVIDVLQERIAVREANKLGIPVIAVVDSNASPKGVDYVIPGNDDAIRAIEFYFNHVQNAVLNAKSQLAPAPEPKVKVTTIREVSKDPKAQEKSKTQEGGVKAEEPAKPKKKIITLKSIDVNDAVSAKNEGVKGGSKASKSSPKAAEPTKSKAAKKVVEPEAKAVKVKASEAKVTKAKATAAKKTKVKDTKTVKAVAKVDAASTKDTSSD